MNFGNIYKAVEADEMNSPLITICSELKRQGYNIKIEGVEVDSLEKYSKLFEDLESTSSEIRIDLSKANEPDRKLKLVFTGYHEFNFQTVN